jgi:EmrB/QacA subfamily drug resistance transporter
MPSRSPAAAGAIPAGRRWIVTTGLLLGNFLAALEATVVSTAMPTVVASLGGLHHYSWVFSAYLLTSTASVPLWGRLSDLYGRRRPYLAAIAIFLVGSMLAGVSQSMVQLILFRALQGLGAGGLIPLSLTIIGEIYTLAERTRMQAVLSSVWGVASVLGPLLGGIITDSISWRWVFFLNLPVGLVAALIVDRTLPEHAHDDRVTVDWQGGLLLFLSTTLLLVALTEASLVWALVGVGCVAVFTRVERRAAHPILPFGLFRNRTVSVATAIGFLSGMTLFGALAFIPLLIQINTGGSATSAGQVLTPIYLMWVLASIVAARTILWSGVRVMTTLGVAAVFVAFSLLPWIAIGSSRAAVFADMGLMGTGLGLALLSLLLAVQHSVARRDLGVATSLNMFARTMGGAVGVAVMGAIVAAGLGKSARFTPSALEGMGLSGLSPELRKRLVVSLQRAFASGAVAAGLALIVSFWMPSFGSPVSGVTGDTAMAGEILLEPDPDPPTMDG